MHKVTIYQYHFSSHCTLFQNVYSGNHCKALGSLPTTQHPLYKGPHRYQERGSTNKRASWPLSQNPLMLLKVFYAQTQCYSNHLIPLFLPQQCSPQYFRRRFRSESLGLYIRRCYSPAYPAYTNHPHWQNGLWKNEK